MPTGLSHDEWSRATSAAYAVYPHAIVEGSNSAGDVLAAYGVLYNWHAVADGRGLCPEGWHVPGRRDWKQFEMHLGLSREEADGDGLRGPGLGGGMKVPRTEPTSHPRWNSPNAGATNASAWSGVPGGGRLFHGPFDFVGSLSPTLTTDVR